MAFKVWVVEATDMFFASNKVCPVPPHSASWMSTWVPENSDRVSRMMRSCWSHEKDIEISINAILIRIMWFSSHMICNEIHNKAENVHVDHDTQLWWPQTRDPGTTGKRLQMFTETEQDLQAAARSLSSVLFDLIGCADTDIDPSFGWWWTENSQGSTLFQAQHTIEKLYRHQFRCDRGLHEVGSAFP